jgi:hypothetical protein
MSITSSAKPHFDSLMDILFAQYSDLEELLVLARREETAAERNDFDEIFEVVKQRATLGDRLEVYHRQLAELRARLGQMAEPVLQTPVVAQTVSILAAIKTHDSRTKPMMVRAREEALTHSMRVDQARRNLGAYAGGARTLSIACDERV